MKWIFSVALIFGIATVSYSQQTYKRKECVIVNGQLQIIEYDYNASTGDRTIMVNGVRKDFHSVYPITGAGYAAEQDWYINNETIESKGNYYVKFGLPRILGVNEIVKSDTYKEVGVYIEAGSLGVAEVIYIPVRQGCEFQPYQKVCGSVSMRKIAETKTTMAIKAIPLGMKKNITYVWSSSQVKIVRGQGTGFVTVDFSGLKNADSFELSLVVKDAANCRLNETRYFEVKK